MKAFLETIDKVYIINLDKRPDRLVKWKELSTFLPSLKEKLFVFSASDGTKIENSTKLTNGEFGCALSHVRIWQDARDNNYRYILVFEDDVLFDNSFELLLAKTLAEIESGFDWLYLFNSWDYRPPESFSENIEKVIASLGTVAYVLNVGAVDRILPFAKEFFFPVDVVMGHMSFLSRVYRPKKIFVRHDYDTPSDIQRKQFVKTRVAKAKDLVRKYFFWKHH